MKTYTYKGIEYKSESQLRKAMWLKDRIALPKLTTVEEWANHGVIVADVAPEPKPIDPERVANRVRRQRDALLHATDYYMMPDYSITEAALANVRAYRQALRDIPSQKGFPTQVKWPEPPNVTE